MTRRALTLLLTAVLALGLAVAGSVATVPYVSLQPGPAYNTLAPVDGHEVLSFSGTGYTIRGGGRSKGALDLVTVSVQDHITLIEALRGWLSPSDAVVPREIVFPADQTTQQNDNTTVVEMQQSQNSATTAALTQLGIKGTTTVSVGGIEAGLPADGKLMVGDDIETVDGVAITSQDGLRAEITKHKAGDDITLGIVRGTQHLTEVLTTVAAPVTATDKSMRPIIGIDPSSSTDFPVKVTIRLDNVGGPSAGLMFALGIIDNLGTTDLTGGRDIAGTGEITDDGVVGAIGGVAQKMRGAKAMGATVFLVPADNCAEAKKTKPSGISLIKVSTLKGALSALSMLRGDTPGTPPPC